MVLLVLISCKLRKACGRRRMRSECRRSVSLFAKRPWAALGNIQAPRYSTTSPIISSATDFKPPKRQQKGRSHRSQFLQWFALERGFWQDELNHKRFLDAFASETRITKVIFWVPNNSSNHVQSYQIGIRSREDPLNSMAVFNCSCTIIPLVRHSKQIIPIILGICPNSTALACSLRGTGGRKRTCCAPSIRQKLRWALPRWVHKNLWSSINSRLQIEDWYSISLAQLKELGFPTKFSRVQLVELLQEKYPEHNWEKVYLFRGRLAQQKRLERAVSSLFTVSPPFRKQLLP